MVSGRRAAPQPRERCRQEARTEILERGRRSVEQLEHAQRIAFEGHQRRREN
jgi:hypothetical protein